MVTLTKRWATTTCFYLAPFWHDLRVGLVGAVCGIAALLYFGQRVGFVLTELGMRIATAGGAQTLVTEADIDVAVAESFAKLTQPVKVVKK